MIKCNFYQTKNKYYPILDLYVFKLDISTMKHGNEKHGGKRKGAGRKRKYDEATKPMRIPLSKISAVYEYLKTGKITTIHAMPVIGLIKKV